jgi:hypothetical protein
MLVAYPAPYLRTMLYYSTTLAYKHYRMMMTVESKVSAFPRAQYGELGREVYAEYVIVV